VRWKGEHVFEAFCHGAITRLLNTTVVCSIKAGEYVATKLRPSRKLEEERRQQVAALLLIAVSKVEIKIGHGGFSRLA
jgi:hypothetical protein